MDLNCEKRYKELKKLKKDFEVNLEEYTKEQKKLNKTMNELKDKASGMSHEQFTNDKETQLLYDATMIQQIELNDKINFTKETLKEILNEMYKIEFDYGKILDSPDSPTNSRNEKKLKKKKKNTDKDIKMVIEI